mgnify:CR=1 FL=1
MAQHVSRFSRLLVAALFVLLLPPIKFSAATDNQPPAQLSWCENAVARTLSVLPKEHIQAIHSLTLSFDPTMRRGLAGGNTLIIRCVDISEKELAAVLVHEVGHVVDTGLLHASSSDKKTSFADRGQTVYSTDPSVRLYAVSWEDNRSFTGQNIDAVSGYSLSNPYEEFAETYAMYVLHGRLFRAYAGNNLKLDQKYRFMKNEVFDGNEYDLGPPPRRGKREALPESTEVNRRAHRAYDVTRMDFNLESFWAL